MCTGAVYTALWYIRNKKCVDLAAPPSHQRRRHLQAECKFYLFHKFHSFLNVKQIRASPKAAPFVSVRWGIWVTQKRAPLGEGNPKVPPWRCPIPKAGPLGVFQTKFGHHLLLFIKSRETTVINHHWYVFLGHVNNGIQCGLACNFHEFTQQNTR